MNNKKVKHVFQYYVLIHAFVDFSFVAFCVTADLPLFRISADLPISIDLSPILLYLMRSG